MGEKHKQELKRILRLLTVVIATQILLSLLESLKVKPAPKVITKELDLQVLVEAIHGEELSTELTVTTEFKHEVLSTITSEEPVLLESTLEEAVPLSLILNLERLVEISVPVEEGLTLDHESAIIQSSMLELHVNLESVKETSLTENILSLEFDHTLLPAVTSESTVSSSTLTTSETILRTLSITGLQSATSEAIKNTPSITGILNASSEAIKVTPSITGSFTSEKTGLQHEIGLEYLWSGDYTNEKTLGLEGEYKLTIPSSLEEPVNLEYESTTQ